MVFGLVKKPVKTRLGVVLTKFYIDGMDNLVKRGIYLERQDCLREGLRLLFEKQFTNK
ncbi:unnamed protein product [marine sediment metagenome]|uniref:Ribbon-helix-helix protein CopG domain-containing protein n=1 Tax=marine sediment metagenome TaxID=412755 RepID=X1KSK0_9ZZZZ